MDRTPAQIALDEFTQTRLDRGEYLWYPAYMSTPLSRSLERLADLHDAPEGCCMDRQPHPRHIHQATAFAAPNANKTVLVRCPGIPAPDVEPVMYGPIDKTAILSRRVDSLMDAVIIAA
jgi:hypothetical protein